MNLSVVNDLYTSLSVMDKNTQYGDELVSEKVKNIPGQFLLTSWKNSKSEIQKEKFEILIAKKLNSLNAILQYNDVPRIYLEYLELVSSIDAIVELLDNLNEKVRTIAYEKYRLFFDKYLEEKEKYKIIQFRRNL